MNPRTRKRGTHGIPQPVADPGGGPRHAVDLALDTSVLVAVLQREPEADRLVAALEAADACYISAATVVELGVLMLGRYGESGEREADLLLHRLRAQAVSVTAEHVEHARSAYRRYGKGRHVAALNFGDCFSYALARSLDLPLLFKGTDFSATDIVPAPY